MCHLPPLARVAVGLMEHVLGEGDGHWQGLYIILRGREEGQWPLINTIFTRRAEKDGADSISETLPFTASLSHATVNKRKTEREINFGLLFFFFFIKNYHLLSRRLTRTVGNVAATPQRRVIIIKPHRLMTANACFVVSRCHNSSQPRNQAILCYISSLTDPINRVVSAQSWLPHPVKWRHAQMGANFPLRPQSNMHSNPPSTIYQPFLTVGAGERSLILPGRSHP